MERWETFYVIVGSSAAALIGIQFVVVTLVAGIRTLTTAESISAFGTPTVVHLSFALVVSAFMTVPWESPFPVAALAAACGLAGLGYLTIVLRRARRQTVYQPVWEDWVWHGVLPAACYLARPFDAAVDIAVDPAARRIVARAQIISQPSASHVASGDASSPRVTEDAAQAAFAHAAIGGSDSSTLPSDRNFTSRGDISRRPGRDATAGPELVGRRVTGGRR